MFLFNKNNAISRSTPSSIESVVTDPATSTSTSNTFVSQCLDASSYGERPSSEHREQYHPAKRGSVFNLRSRSNTTTSTTSSFVSVSPTMARPGSSRRSSREFSLITSQSFADLPGAKRSLFTRARRGTRKSGYFTPSPDTENDEEVDVGRRRTSVFRKSKRAVNPSEGSLHHLKQRISSPFDFQHLTHTDRHQFAALDHVSGNDIVASFWAIRASQVPRRDLNGIKADDLHFNNFSSENLADPMSRCTSTLGVRSPPLSPEPPHEAHLPDSPQQSTRPGLRTSRSVESFSRPGVNPRAHRHTQSANPPPFVPSHLSLAPLDDLLEESSDTQLTAQPSSVRSSRYSGTWDQYTAFPSPSVDIKLPAIGDESDCVGHAVTTPDDSAIHPTTPPFTPRLENVAEEQERFVSPRPAPAPPMRTPQSPRSPFFESYSSRQRTPITRSTSRGSSFSSPKSATQRTPMTRPISQMSDTLGSPIVLRRNSIRRSPTGRRKSNTWRVMEESWEDDVDYIYNNALEADCDFDWEHTTEDAEVSEDRDRTPEQHDHEGPPTAVSQGTQTTPATSEEEPILQSRFFPGAFRPSLLVPSVLNVPELESRSAVSASTADTSVQTPSDLFNPMSYQQGHVNEEEGFSLTPSLLVPPAFRKHVSHEEMYDDLLADYEGSDRHFPLIDASQSVSGSSRSSRVRSSKRSSYDSSLVSSGQASGSWNSPVRRSASSSGSLPELVHSRRARRDFSVMVDHLSEQVASFAAFGEDETEDAEDDDTTPPGRPSQGRTFFASDEEAQQVQKIRASIEGEVRASLELARRGSQRSSRAPLPCHKYASSDGAAKLLASPMQATPELQPAPKTRNRSATSSNAVRGSKQPYLSLFPAPPKHSQPSTPTTPLTTSGH